MHGPSMPIGRALSQPLPSWATMLWFICIEIEGSLKDHMLRKYPLAFTLMDRYSVIKLAREIGDY